MTLNGNTTHRQTALADLIEWRRSQLADAGFDPWTADVFARTEAVDLLAVLELVERGCTPELAARIMAPIDFEPPRR
jgi:CelD/BcsL family acetyltransferase involved in cellulose biosynthesis